MRTDCLIIEKKCRCNSALLTSLFSFLTPKNHLNVVSKAERYITDEKISSWAQHVMLLILDVPFNCY